MMRGEVWTVSAGRTYAGKPRPAVLLQDDHFGATESVTVCPFTTSEVDAPLMRLPVAPTAQNGLRIPCCLMVDKITTVPRARLGQRVGRLTDEDLLRLNLAVRSPATTQRLGATRGWSWWTSIRTSLVRPPCPD